MGISTNWLHPAWNTTGSVNVSERPPGLPVGQPMFTGQGIRMNAFNASGTAQAAPMSGFSFGNWGAGEGGGGGGGHGGGGGGGGFARYGDYMTADDAARRGVKIDANPNHYVPTTLAPRADTFGKPMDRGSWVPPTRAYGGSAGPGPIIVGDPQKDGKPNPEIVFSSAPMHVIPIKDLHKKPMHLPKFANGTAPQPQDGEIRIGQDGQPWQYDATQGKGFPVSVDPAAFGNQPEPPQPVAQAPVGVQQQATPPQPVMGQRFFAEVPKDPLEKLWDDPVALARQKQKMGQFIGTPEGARWLTDQQQVQRAAAAAHNEAVAKFNAEQQSKAADIEAQNWRAQQANERAAATIDAANKRAEQAIQATAKRQQAGFNQADRTKKDAEDTAYADAVGRLRTRWNAGLLTPDEMIRFEGLETSKAIEAELKHIEEQRKLKAPATITELPTDRPVAVGSGANPRISNPLNKSKREIITVQQVVIDPKTQESKTMQVPHYIEHNPDGTPRLVPVDVGKQQAPQQQPASIPTFKTPAELRAAGLPSGAKFKTADGEIRTVK